jgi:hypothetical protein
VNFKPLIYLLSLLWWNVLSLPALEISNRSGVQIDVELLAIEPERIHIKMQNGQSTWLDRQQLSDTSQAKIRQLETSERKAYLALNNLLGIDLFADTRLWDDATTSVAARLKWPQESQTDSQTSYRKYPPASASILQARPYSAALYGQAGHPELISIVFANKGDFKFSSPPSSQEINEMEQAIERDVKQIEENLSQQLGEPKRQQFGSGRSMKHSIDRWDWKEHAFILAAEDGEYASLKIMPTELADNKGLGKKLSDDSLRQLAAENVETADNGDVIIGNIPMVNQGPKGYCVPATFERYLRYMQIPADMYLLAMAGQTKIGGGTSLSNTINSISDYVSSQNRSMKKLTSEIKVRSVRKYIDRGLPVIWTMFSTSEYNTFVNLHSKNRKQTNDWDAWKKHCRDESRQVELQKDDTTAHACMIIGYNDETDEIAVSDSWGPKYTIRWVTTTQAEQVSQGSIYLIEF